MNVTSVLYSPLQNTRPAERPLAATAAFDVPPLPKPPDPARIAEIKARYDMTSISPREIDELFTALTEAGHPIDDDMLTLSSHGEEFQLHLATVIAEAMGNTRAEPTGTAFSPTGRINLVEFAHSQMKFARQHGNVTEPWVGFIEFLDGFGQQANIQSPGVAQQVIQAQLAGPS